MKPGELLFRPFRIGDEAGIYSLWNAAFGKTMDPAIWNWKYMQNPYGRQIILCEGERNEILAAYCGIPFRANWNGESVHLTQLMDIMSHPQYRGRGLFVRAANRFFDIYGPPEGSVCLYGFPGEYHFKLGRRILNYEALAGGIAFLGAEPENLMPHQAPFRGRTKPVKAVGEALDRLAEACLAEYPFAVIRNSEFVRWRFLDNPRREYGIWAYKTYTGKKWKAYAVLAFEQEKACVVDLLAPNSGKILPDFMARLAAECRRQGIRKIETWLPDGHFLSNELQRCGFERLPEPLGIIATVKILDPRLSCRWISGNIFYSMADADLF